jgi:hypothetical protein
MASAIQALLGPARRTLALPPLIPTIAQGLMRASQASAGLFLRRAFALLLPMLGSAWADRVRSGMVLGKQPVW